MALLSWRYFTIFPIIILQLPLSKSSTLKHSFQSIKKQDDTGCIENAFRGVIRVKVKVAPVLITRMSGFIRDSWMPRDRLITKSLFKTSHVTRRPSLKRLSGIQVQLLSLCMGKHQILQNCSLSLRLNFIFEITNEIGQQLCHKCCFFCSNSVIKSLFLRLDQPVRMRSPERASQSAHCFYNNRDF